MTYGPVNRKTLASVNRVNRQVQDSDIQRTTISMNNGKWTCPECGKANSTSPSNFSQSVQCAQCGSRFNFKNWNGKDSDLQEPQDPGESNDAVVKCQNCNHPEGAHTKHAGKPGRQCALCSCGNFIPPPLEKLSGLPDYM